MSKRVSGKSWVHLAGCAYPGCEESSVILLDMWMRDTLPEHGPRIKAVKNRDGTVTPLYCDKHQAMMDAGFPWRCKECGSQGSVVRGELFEAMKAKAEEMGVPKIGIEFARCSEHQTSEEE